MKKNYQKPAMRVVKVQHRSQILAASEKLVNETKSNLSGTADEIKYGGSDDNYTDFDTYGVR